MIDEFFEVSPYEWDREKKEQKLTKELIELTKHHRENCPEYASFLNAVGYDESKVKSYKDIPFFPVRLFKERELKSIPDDSVFKTMTSSGTSGQKVSKIFVDQETAMLQQKTMIHILNDFWGKQRLPMMIIDTPKVMKDRTMFSARGAAIMGLQFMARKMVYVLNDDMSLNEEALGEFLEKYGDKPFVIFGFTFMVWEHLYKQLEMQKNKIDKLNSNEKTGHCFGLKSDNNHGLKYDLSNAWLFTGGGWKKIEEEKVSREEFKKRVGEVTGITHFIDHYGMVEQTGCIYAECECGHLHASIFSDVIPRRYDTWEECEIGEKGILQVVSVLPHSYPGHSLLTEDEGIVLGEDDCPCGRKGKYVQILGRIKKAEVRGCSDTYATDYAK